MPDIYFEHSATGRKYHVVNMALETGEVTLKGQHAEFTEKYDKERFVAMGYVLKRSED